jgi:hypothetical protein
MTMDCSDSDRHRVAPQPLIATFAHDDLAARRIECALAADGMNVAMRGWSPDGPDDDGVDPEVLVVALGRGVTERDQQMRRLRRRMPDIHIVAVMPEDSRRGVRRALESGADGVVFESELETALSLTVRAILAGQTAVPAARRHEVDRPTLSSREKQVIGLLQARGPFAQRGRRSRTRIRRGAGVLRSPRPGPRNHGRKRLMTTHKTHPMKDDRA